MIKAKKITGLIMLVVALMVSMTTLAFASTSHTTGMKDDIYVASSAKNSAGQFYKMNVTVSGGKVSTFSFAYYTNDTTPFTTGFLKYVQDATQKAQLQAILDEQAVYNTQMATVLDGVKVTKYSSAASADMYNTFQALWKDIVTQAGGQIVADAAAAASTTTSTATASTTKASTTTASTSTSNPKTGDNGSLVYVILAGAAIVSMTVLGRKKLTA